MALTDWHARHVFIHFHYGDVWYWALACFLLYTSKTNASRRMGLKVDQNEINKHFWDCVGWMKIYKNTCFILVQCTRFYLLHCDFFNLKAWHFWHPNYWDLLSFGFTVYYQCEIVHRIDRIFNLFHKMKTKTDPNFLNRKSAIFNMSSIHHNISNECVCVDSGNVVRIPK